MASIIRIKRSSGTSKPASLQWGELGYVTGIGSFGGTNQYKDRIFLGDDGTNVHPVGGHYYTSMMEHAPGTIPAASYNTRNQDRGIVAIMAPATNSGLGGAESLKVDQWNVDNIRIDLNTISSTDTDGDIVLDPNGTGEVVVGGNTNPGTLVLNCESNSHGIKLQSPAHSSGQSYTLKFPTGNVTADRFLKVASVSGSGTTGVGQLSFAEVSGGTSWQAVKTSTFTAVAGEGYFINTTAGAIEMNLPAGNIGDEVSFIDYAGTFDTNPLTIDQNGSEKIAGSTDPLTVSTERAANTLVYVDSTQGWLLKNN